VVSYCYVLTKVFTRGLSSRSISTLFTMGICPTKPHIFMSGLCPGGFYQGEFYHGGFCPRGLMSNTCATKRWAWRKGLASVNCASNRCQKINSILSISVHTVSVAVIAVNYWKLLKGYKKPPKAYQKLLKAYRKLPIGDNQRRLVLRIMVRVRLAVRLRIRTRIGFGLYAV